MKKNKKISVIIPSYNSCRTISRTLESIEVQSQKELVHEVIVVDSSDDGKTEEVLRVWEERGVKIIRAGKKVMPGAGRNIGAGRAEGSLLAFIDADAYAKPDWLEILWEAFREGALIGGGSIEPALFQRENPLAMAQYFLQFNSFMAAGKKRQVSFVTGCNMFCQRELFLDMGGIPEIRAAEDVLFCLKEPQGVWFIPNATVCHIFRDDRQDAFRNQKLLGKYVFIYRKRFYDGLLYKGFVPIVLFPAGLAVKITRMLFRIFSGGRKYVFIFMRSLFFFIAGLFHWSAGYIEGCLEEYKGGDAR